MTNQQWENLKINQDPFQATREVVWYHSSMHQRNFQKMQVLKLLKLWRMDTHWSRRCTSWMEMKFLNNSWSGWKILKTRFQEYYLSAPEKLAILPRLVDMKEQTIVSKIKDKFEDYTDPDDVKELQNYWIRDDIAIHCLKVKIFRNERLGLSSFDQLKCTMIDENRYQVQYQDLESTIQHLLRLSTKKFVAHRS